MRREHGQRRRNQRRSLVIAVTYCRWPDAARRGLAPLLRPLEQRLRAADPNSALSVNHPADAFHRCSADDRQIGESPNRSIDDF